MAEADTLAKQIKDLTNLITAMDARGPSAAPQHSCIGHKYVLYTGNPALESSFSMHNNTKHPDRWAGTTWVPEPYPGRSWLKGRHGN
jgi:hypothetical protein